MVKDKKTPKKDRKANYTEILHKYLRKRTLFNVDVFVSDEYVRAMDIQNIIKAKAKSKKINIKILLRSKLLHNIMDYVYHSTGKEPRIRKFNFDLIHIMVANFILKSNLKDKYNHLDYSWIADVVEKQEYKAIQRRDKFKGILYSFHKTKTSTFNDINKIMSEIDKCCEGKSARETMMYAFIEDSIGIYKDTMIGYRAAMEYFKNNDIWNQTIGDKQ